MIEAVTFDFWNTIAGIPTGAMSEARSRAVATACEDRGLEVEADRLATLLDEVALSYERSWSEGMHFYVGPTLGALAERGIRLGIVCDVGFTGGELLRGLLEREGLLRHFSGWAFSDEVGHYKPAPHRHRRRRGARHEDRPLPGPARRSRRRR